MTTRQNIKMVRKEGFHAPSRLFQYICSFLVLNCIKLLQVKLSNNTIKYTGIELNLCSFYAKRAELCPSGEVSILYCLTKGES